MPVTPLTTVSFCPPTAEATTGTPHAMASRATMPKGSYQGTQIVTCAERIRAGTSSLGTWPTNRTRSATPALHASSRRRITSGSPSSSSAGGPPTTTSSASLMLRSASMTVSTPLRGTRRPRESSRGRRGLVTGDGANSSVSTPHGTTQAARRGTFIRSSSVTSSPQVAMTASTLRPMTVSALMRCGGLVSSLPWWRRLTVPSAW
jgi:hypothetical protein